MVYIQENLPNAELICNFDYFQKQGTEMQFVALLLLARCFQMT